MRLRLGLYLHLWNTFYKNSNNMVILKSLYYLHTELKYLDSIFQGAIDKIVPNRIDKI